MSDTALTPRQLADILFQRPERITAGILDRRTPGALLRDRVMTRTKKEDMGYQPGSLELWKRRMLLEFTRVAPVHEEHPRAFRNALLELRALGYTNLQLRWVSYETAVTVIDFFEPPYGPGSEKFRDHALLRSDQGFLGYIASRKLSGNGPLSFDDLSNSIRAWQNPDNNTNCIFSEDDEDTAHAWFVTRLENVRRHRPALFTAGQPMPAVTP